MSERLEIEGKYYLDDADKLIEILNNKNFKKIGTEYEKDEYFTDLDYNFIKDRTCLRLRTTNNSTVELTYKGKSNNLDAVYAKIEKNISINLSDYNNLVEILKALKYDSYVIVDKKRITYSKKINDITYNVMIDTIKNCGDFVEFEVITDKDRKDGEKIFQNYIDELNANNLKIVTLPYRDIVKEAIDKSK